MLTSFETVQPIEMPPRKRIDIETIVRSNLPPLPGNVMKISEMLQDENTSSKQLATAISKDPSLTSRLLRLANSPIYPMHKNVSSIQQAVEVVGTKSLYDIVMLSIAADSFAKEIRTSAIGRAVWEHSLVVALCAKEISRVMGMRGVEEAFICGLLHDIGKIMMLRADVDNYSNILEKRTELEVLHWETETYGYTHAQVGALVTNRWRLPDQICHAIMNHHNPSESSQSVFLASLITVADIMANFNGYGLRLEDETSLFSSEAVFMLRLTEDQIHTVWERVQAGLSEVLSAI